MGKKILNFDVDFRNKVYKFAYKFLDSPYNDSGICYALIKSWKQITKSDENFLDVDIPSTFPELDLFYSDKDIGKYALTEFGHKNILHKDGFWWFGETQKEERLIALGTMIAMTE